MEERHAAPWMEPQQAAPVFNTIQQQQAPMYFMANSQPLWGWAPNNTQVPQQPQLPQLAAASNNNPPPLYSQAIAPGGLAPPGYIAQAPAFLQAPQIVHSIQLASTTQSAVSQQQHQFNPSGSSQQPQLQPPGYAFGQSGSPFVFVPAPGPSAAPFAHPSYAISMQQPQPQFQGPAWVTGGAAAAWAPPGATFFAPPHAHVASVPVAQATDASVAAQNTFTQPPPAPPQEHDASSSLMTQLAAVANVTSKTQHHTIGVVAVSEVILSCPEAFNDLCKLFEAREFSAWLHVSEDGESMSREELRRTLINDFGPRFLLVVTQWGTKFSPRISGVVTCGPKSLGDDTWRLGAFFDTAHKVPLTLCVLQLASRFWYALKQRWPSQLSWRMPRGSIESRRIAETALVFHAKQAEQNRHTMVEALFSSVAIREVAFNASRTTPPPSNSTHSTPHQGPQSIAPSQSSDSSPRSSTKIVGGPLSEPVENSPTIKIGQPHHREHVVPLSPHIVHDGTISSFGIPTPASSVYAVSEYAPTPANPSKIFFDVSFGHSRAAQRFLLDLATWGVGTAQWIACQPNAQPDFFAGIFSVPWGGHVLFAADLPLSCRGFQHLPPASRAQLLGAKLYAVLDAVAANQPATRSENEGAGENESLPSTPPPGAQVVAATA